MKKLKKTYLNALFIIFFSLFSSISLLSSSPLDQLTQDEILPADEAFKLSVNKHSENRIILRWDMKENCFLYKDKFQINILPEDILEINTMEAPILISDKYFGEVEVFYKKITKSFFINPLTRKITVKYQGCNEKGFCYPLISKELILKNGEIFINKGT